MSVHAVAGLGGSAGKTTTAATVAALEAEAHRRVLLIDMDPQGNATLSVGATAVSGKTTGDVLIGRASLDEVAVETVALPGLWIAPADGSLDDAAVQLTLKVGGEQQLRLALAALTTSYDIVIIDCPGTASILTIAALVAADSVIAVSVPTLKEIEGLPRLENVIADVARAYNPTLRLTAVVPCNVPPSNAGQLYLDGMTQLHQLYGDLVTPPIRRSVRVPEAYSQRVPLPIYAPHEGVTFDYQAVTDELGRRKVMP
jgi:chromosome partitioning protein